jgi:hypothetical protein
LVISLASPSTRETRVRRDRIEPWRSKAMPRFSVGGGEPSLRAAALRSADGEASGLSLRLFPLSFLT